MAELLAELSALEVKKPGIDPAQGEEWLSNASNLVRDEGDPSWTAETVPPRVSDIVVEVARRAAENPGAHSQTSVGDVSVSYRGSGSQQDAIYLTRKEHRAVKRAAGRLGQTVTLVSPYGSGGSTYFHPVEGQSEPFPLL